MRSSTSPRGQQEAVSVRMSESADAQAIERLIGPSAAVFGRVNVLHLLERANLAVTLANEKEEILAHASFLDHPLGDVVDPRCWEPFLQSHLGAEACTVGVTGDASQLLSGFILFVTVNMAVFDAVVELEHVCLVGPHVAAPGSVLAPEPEPALQDVFEPLQRAAGAGPRCWALISHRHEHCPKLRFRTARVEDHDDIMNLFKEQAKLLPAFDDPYFLAELLDSQDQRNHSAVCERDGVPVGLVSLTSAVALRHLVELFDLSELEAWHQAAAAGSSASRPGETQPTGCFPESSNVVSIQAFVMDKDYENRSVDFLPYIFSVFPDLDFLLITVATTSPEFPLLQSFLRVPPRASCSPPRQLYVLHRAGLSSVVEVRPAAPADRPAVSDLVTGLRSGEALMRDLDRYHQTRRDQTTTSTLHHATRVFVIIGCPALPPQVLQPSGPGVVLIQNPLVDVGH
ncbi:Cilia- and flagella-associated protein 61 [Liparis tanakae]|uniref:Cilia-and flagella-associated protein 61 n=1 Tax=Liparis tanakae TaxID=230148 RepID=A0A4Z2FDP4_9TELE|nr:Cilia- and flagella-associated protein 61 [Liparis tanakae]